MDKKEKIELEYYLDVIDSSKWQIKKLNLENEYLYDHLEQEVPFNKYSFPRIRTQLAKNNESIEEYNYKLKETSLKFEEILKKNNLKEEDIKKGSNKELKHQVQNFDSIEGYQQRRDNYWDRVEYAEKKVLEYIKQIKDRADRVIDEASENEYEVYSFGNVHDITALSKDLEKHEDSHEINFIYYTKTFEAIEAMKEKHRKVKVNNTDNNVNASDEEDEAGLSQ